MSSSIAPLERIILHFWNREMQTNIATFILYKFNKPLERCCVLTKFDKFQKLLKILIKYLKNIYLWKISKIPVLQQK